MLLEQSFYMDTSFATSSRSRRGQYPFRLNMHRDIARLLVLLAVVRVLTVVACPAPAPPPRSTLRVADHHLRQHLTVRKPAFPRNFSRNSSNSTCDSAPALATQRLPVFKSSRASGTTARSPAPRAEPHGRQLAAVSPHPPLQLRAPPARGGGERPLALPASHGAPPVAQAPPIRGSPRHKPARSDGRRPQPPPTGGSPEPHALLPTALASAPAPAGQPAAPLTSYRRP